MPREHSLEGPAKILVPAFTPFRNPRDSTSGRREQEARDRQRDEQVARCRVDWLYLRERVTDRAALAVLDLHQPEKTYSGATCAECASYDREGLSEPDWPCDTVQAIADAPEGS